MTTSGVEGGDWQDVFQAAEAPFTTPPLPKVGEYWWKVKPLGADAAGSSNQFMFYLCDQERIRALTVASTDRYAIGCRLDLGHSVYTDRPYTFTSLPDELVGLPWIISANEDADATDAAHLSFVIDRPADVTVGYDARMTDLPLWLRAFTPTPAEIHISDEDSYLKTYTRRFPAGTVVLGANRAEGAGRSQNNYIVLVRLLP